MSTPQARTREDVLAPIAAAFEEAAPDGGGAEFVARYFRHVPLDELTSRTADIYAGAAASHLELARHRLPGRGERARLQPQHRGRRLVAAAHTVVEIVTDDMPFLVDSVTGALVSAGSARSTWSSTRSSSSAATSPASSSRSCPRRHRQGGQGRRRRAAPSRGCTSRSTARATRTTLAELERDLRDVLRGRARGRRGLAEDAQQVPAASPTSSRAPRRRGVDADEVARGHRAACAGWPTTTSPSSATASTRLRRSDGERRARAPCPAPASASCAPTSRSRRAFRQAARRRSRAQGPRAEAAGAHQGQLPLDRAPPGLPRLRRRQEVRRRRRGRRRAPLPRPVLLRRLHRVRAADPGAAPRRSREVLERVRLRRPTATPARTCSRSSRPTRATSCSRPASTSCYDDRDGGAAPAGAPPDPAVPARRRLRPLRVLPGLPAARPLHHRRPRCEIADILRGELRRRVASTTPRGSPSRCWPGCTSSSAPPTGAADPRRRRRRRSSAGSPRRPARGTTTSPTRCVDQFGEEDGGRLLGRVRRRLPRGLQGGLPGRAAASPTSAASRPLGDDARHRPDALPSRSTPADGERAASRSSARRPAVAVRRCCRCCHSHGRRGRRRAAVRGRAAPTAPACTSTTSGCATARRQLPADDAREPVPGRVRRGLGRLQRDRRLQRAGARAPG